jgi:hypothetical protein
VDERRHFVGERVRVSRAQDGENHEEATAVDFYDEDEHDLENDEVESEAGLV